MATRIDLNADPMALSKVMEFDHVIRVNDDGTVSDEPNVYAPTLYGDGNAETGNEWLDSPKWEFVTMGYTRQHGYAGPIMHNSELIGGRLAEDILESPGVYVAVVCNWDDDYVEGWAILRFTG